MVLFQSINKLADPAGGGIFSGPRRRRLFIPPSTKQPLFRYGDGDQRSFLLLMEPADQDDLTSDAASVSTSRLLPSTLSSAQSEQESFHTWLLEEHHRRYALQSNQCLIDEGLPKPQSLSSVASGKTHVRSPSVQELYTLTRYAAPLIVTFVMEHLFAMVCLVVVGRLGKNELASVLLATMIATITFGVFEGLATALDTLCPRAFGANNFKDVGLQVQRLIVLLWVIFIPCGFVWWNCGFVLKWVIDSQEVLDLTLRFLRVLMVGAPAYIAFENGKRFLQAQGIFEAGTGVLLLSAPLNACLAFFLVWNKRYGVGYIGAAIAAAVNYWLMAFLLVLYVIYIDGSKCWLGLAPPRSLFAGWGDLLNLGIPGVVMLELEYIAYEIMTLLALVFGVAALAAQSTVSSIALLTYMVPFAVGIAVSTRIATLIGAQNALRAKTAAYIGLFAALFIGCANGLFLFAFRNQIAATFTKDPAVAKEITSLLHPLVSIIQIFDAVACVSLGILRAQGAQKAGGAINFVSYYAFALPLALVLSRIAKMGLAGLWLGVGSGMFLIAISETLLILFSDWDQILMRAALNEEIEDD